MNTLQELYGFTYSLEIPSQSVLGDENSGILGLLYGGVSQNHLNFDKEEISKIIFDINLK